MNGATRSCRKSRGTPLLPTRRSLTPYRRLITLKQAWWIQLAVSVSPGTTAIRPLEQARAPVMKRLGVLSCGVATSLLLLWPMLSTVDAALLVGLRTVVLSGDPAPGASSGAVFSGVGIPHLDNFGRVSMEAEISEPMPAGFSDRGFWTERAGELQLVVRGGQTAPGFPPEQTFTDFIITTERFVSRSGAVAFRGQTTLPPIEDPNNPPNPTFLDNSGVWVYGSTGSLELVARAGEQAAGAPAGQVHHSFLEDVAVNSVGDVALAGSLRGTGVTSSNDQAVWLWRNGSLEMIAREGDEAPNSPGTTIGVIQTPIALNSSGVVAFYATPGIWKYDSAHGLVNVVRNNEPAAGFADGSTVRVVRSPRINSDGDLVFRGIVRHPDGDESYTLWGEADGARRIIASEGMPAPGTAAGIYFFDVFANIPAIDDFGRATFHASLGGPGIDLSNEDGIWTEAGGHGLKLVARHGDQAPGVPPGARFSNLSFNTILNVNGPGQIAFMAELTGSGVSGSNNVGIWATGLDGVLRLVAREGDQIDVSNGAGTDVRTIRGLYFHPGKGNDSGGNSSFNDLGQIAFGVQFTDFTSGIFVANAVAVPEPALLLPLAVSFVTVWLVRRKSR